MPLPLAGCWQGPGFGWPLIYGGGFGLLWVGCTFHTGNFDLVGKLFGTKFASWVAPSSRFAARPQSQLCRRLSAFICPRRGRQPVAPSISHHRRRMPWLPGQGPENPSNDRSRRSDAPLPAALHPRLVFHFTPTLASWPNAVEGLLRQADPPPT